MNRQKYFEFLIKQVGAERGSYFEQYMNLLSYLFHHEFRWDFSIPTDANRADDGVYLRSLYFMEIGKEQEDIHELPCSILEMLIGLANRMEGMMSDNPENDHPERWFWEMINNLGLSDMTDANYDGQKVIDIIGTFIGRAYHHNGLGGLFPLRRTMIDQRRIPIWDQMSMYLNENYL